MISTTAPSLSQPNGRMTLGHRLILLMLFLAPFTVPIVGGGSLGPVSPRYLREVLIIAGCLAGLLILVSSRGFVLALPGNARLPVLFWALFVVYYCATLVDSLSIANGLRYAPKLVLPLVVFLFLIQLRDLCPDRAFRAIRAGILAYLVGSILLYAVQGTPFLEGFSGRHYSKFVALAGLIIAFSEMFSGRMSRRSWILLLVCLVSIALILQRGVLLAGFAGCLAVLLVARSRGEHAKRLLLLVLLVVALALLTTSERFITYAFYAHISPEVIWQQLMDGNLNPDLLRDRGRLDWIRILFAMSPPSTFGIGMGSVPTLLGQSLGLSHYELHNDILMIFFEAGYVGFALFALAIISTFVWSVRGVLRSTGQALLYYRVAFGMLVACTVWMFFSNVWNYSSVGVTMALVFLVLAEKGSGTITQRAGRAAQSGPAPAEAGA